MLRVLILVVLMSSSAIARMFMPQNVFSSNNMIDSIEPMVYEPVQTQDTMDEIAKVQHMRNCFFTPVQCMLPTTDSHKDVQSLHGVYNPSTVQVRRNVDNVLTSPLGFNDLYKRSGDNRIFQWLSRF